MTAQTCFLRTPLRHYVKIAATYLSIVSLFSGCFQIKERQERLSVTDSVYAPDSVAAIGQWNDLLIGGIEAEEFEFNNETSAKIVDRVVNQWQKAGYRQVKSAYRPWGELGMRLYSDFARSRDSTLPLSAAVRKNFLHHNPNAKYLLYLIIQSQKDTQTESAIRYTNIQTMSIDYRIWDLAQGDLLLDVRVQGFSFKSNEKHVTEQPSFGKALLENAIYFMAYDGMPESMSLPDFIDKTTSAVIQHLQKLPAGTES